MSESRIGNFYRGDSLNVQASLQVDGSPKDLRGLTILVALRSPGATAAPVVLKTYVVPQNSSTAAQGKETVPLLPADTQNADPGEYVAYLVLLEGTSYRWTIHEEKVVVKKGLV